MKVKYRERKIEVREQKEKCKAIRLRMSLSPADLLASLSITGQAKTSGLVWKTLRLPSMPWSWC